MLRCRTCNFVADTHRLEHGVVIYFRASGLWFFNYFFLFDDVIQKLSHVLTIFLIRFAFGPHMLLWISGLWSCFRTGHLVTLDKLVGESHGVVTQSRETLFHWLVQKVFHSWHRLVLVVAYELLLLLRSQKTWVIGIVQIETQIWNFILVVYENVRFFYLVCWDKIKLGGRLFSWHFININIFFKTEVV